MKQERNFSNNIQCRILTLSYIHIFDLVDLQNIHLTLIILERLLKSVYSNRSLSKWKNRKDKHYTSTFEYPIKTNQKGRL